MARVGKSIQDRRPAAAGDKRAEELLKSIHDYVISSLTEEEALERGSIRGSLCSGMLEK
jgi:hypothetical protein